MNHLYKTILFLFVITTFNLSVSGQSSILYYMDQLHQANFMNPAYQSKYNTFIGLPGLSGVSVEAANSAFSYNDLIHKGTGKLKDSLIIDIEKVKSNLKNKNYLMTGVKIPILGLGFWVRNTYFTFDITNTTVARISYPGNLIKLVNGNSNFIGENNPLKIDGIGPFVQNYNEFAFGLSKQITYRLTIGGKFKLLLGNACVQSQKSELKLYTQPETYAMRIETDFRLNASAPVTFKYDKNGQITDIVNPTGFEVSQVLSAKNMGAAVDLGAIYQFNDHVKFYASVIDFGFIRWKNNVENISQSGKFEFSGLSLDSIFTNSNYNEFTAIADSLSNFFTFKSSSKKFNTYLPTNVYLGTTYDLGRALNVGFLSRTYFFDKALHQAFSLSANLKPVKWFGMSVSYSYIDRSYRNLGFGLSLKTGFSQFYIFTDNLNIALRPKDAKALRFQFGFNLVFGYDKRNDYSMLKDRKPQKSIDFM